MWEKVGVLRTGDKLKSALEQICRMQDNLLELSPASGNRFNLTLQDWFDLRSGLLTAEAVTLSAINRRESRGAHQREDFAKPCKNHEKNQSLKLNNDGLLISDFVPVVKLSNNESPDEQ